MLSYYAIPVEWMCEQGCYHKGYDTSGKDLADISVKRFMPSGKFCSVHPETALLQRLDIQYFQNLPFKWKANEC